MRFASTLVVHSSLMVPLTILHALLVEEMGAGCAAERCLVAEIALHGSHHKQGCDQLHAAHPQRANIVLPNTSSFGLNLAIMLLWSR